MDTIQILILALI